MFKFCLTVAADIISIQGHASRCEACLIKSATTSPLPSGRFLANTPSEAVVQVTTRPTLVAAAKRVSTSSSLTGNLGQHKISTMVSQVPTLTC
jgi:hypothetical protein